MSVLAIDLGGTKLAAAVFNHDGQCGPVTKLPLGGRQGRAVADQMVALAGGLIAEAKQQGNPVQAIGVVVPGIYHKARGTVWAPNIPGWEDYPLRQTLQTAFPGVSVSVDSDRTGYILGECWQGAGQGYANVIYMAVGTGIGAGMLIDGKVLHGANGIAGAIGWMALDPPFREAFVQKGCFESMASGAGMVTAAQQLLRSTPGYDGALTQAKSPESLTTNDLFEAYAQGDPIACEVIRQAIARWGMAVANLVSLFNPQKVILGGGVFGPATGLIPDIKAEAQKWAQPVSMQQVTIEGSALGNRAGLYGAAYLAINPSHATQ